MCACNSNEHITLSQGYTRNNCLKKTPWNKYLNHSSIYRKYYITFIGAIFINFTSIDLNEKIIHKNIGKISINLDYAAVTLDIFIDIWFISKVCTQSGSI